MTDETARQLIQALNANTEAVRENTRAAGRVQEQLVTTEDDLDELSSVIEDLGRVLADQDQNTFDAGG